MRKTTGGKAPSGRLLSDIFMAIPGTILILNPMGRVLFLSITDDDILGHEPEHWIGQSGLDLVHPDDVSLVTHRISCAVEGRDAPRHAIQIRVGADNNWLKVQAVGFSLIDFEGAPGILIALRDITGSSAARNARSFAFDSLGDDTRIGRATQLPVDNRHRLVDDLLPSLLFSQGPSCHLLLVSVTLTNDQPVRNQLGDERVSGAMPELVRLLRAASRSDDLIVRVTQNQLVIASVGVANQTAGVAIAERTRDVCQSLINSQTFGADSAFATRIGWALTSRGDNFEEVYDFITEAEHFGVTVA